MSFALIFVYKDKGLHSSAVLGPFNTIKRDEITQLSSIPLPLWIILSKAIAFDTNGNIPELWHGLVSILGLSKFSNKVAGKELLPFQIVLK